MGGKAAILLVLGFSMIFLVLGHNFNNLSTRAVDNFAAYYDSTVAQNLAFSGVNIIANRFFFSSFLNDQSGEFDFQGGKIEYSFRKLSMQQSEITVKGIVDEDNFGKRVEKLIKVRLGPTAFSRFAYFSMNEGTNIWWTTGDIINGPMHINQNLNVNGSPVFNGFVTYTGSIIYRNGEGIDNPQFNGGEKSGVVSALPRDEFDKIDSAAIAGGKKISNQDTVYLDFRADSIEVKYGFNSPDTTYLLADYAPNGVIMAEGADVRMKGVVNGQYTVSTRSAYSPAIYETRTQWDWWCRCTREVTVLVTAAGTKGGNVKLDDDIVYQDDPTVNPAADDLLGIVAEHEVIITDNVPNRSNINIHASIFSLEGGFGAENYGTRPVSGFINLLGGIIQNNRRAVGTFSGGNPASGFSKRYNYDRRLLVSSPPLFPGTGNFQIISWYE